MTAGEGALLDELTKFRVIVSSGMESVERSESCSPESTGTGSAKVTSFSIADILKCREERREQKQKLLRDQQDEALDMRRKSMKYKVN
ncbi:hypothetical protein RUM43_013155 [Polyplax serrata]|uniref:Uncharacterized protein n=1 Tax=Polyplax serrata TaxID=468196 RepID=A0AAN8NRL2_POLSC